MGDSIQVSYQSEMNWDGDENENDDDGDKTWESLTSANSPVDVVRLHCNVELEQEKASELMPRSDPTPQRLSTRILEQRRLELRRRQRRGGQTAYRSR